MRTPAEDDEVTHLLREYDRAVAAQVDAAMRIRAASEALSELGVDIARARRVDARPGVSAHGDI